ncbi:MAG: DNA primase [Thermonemataceae bacterium]|nr:DNA primase [Thermonemataceae bacterium]
MRIPSEVVDKIYQQIDIVEVVSDYVSLKKAGKDWKACCPFHNEKTPSFSVSPAKNIYKCFGCGKGGDPVNFVMEIEGVSYAEALKQLAKKYQIELPEEALAEPTQEEIQKQNERDSLFIVLNHAKNFFQEQLFYTEEGKAIALPYFKERGFNEQTIKTFELGYAPSDWDSLYRNAVRKGYQATLLEKAGLTVQKEGKKEYYDRFRERVVFPIHNISGRVVAFGARTLKKDKSIAKYINSPETDLYQKSKVLYGLFQAKKAILEANECLLVEGYADVISLHQAAIKNVVASSGTSLTNEQIRLIRRFTHHITLLYDSDKAGIAAAIRGLDIILEEGLSVKIVLLPENEDPDSFVRKKGTNATLSYIKENAEDFIKFKTKFLLKDAENDPFKRGEAIREVVASITKIPDVIQRNVFFKECSLIFGIEEGVLIGEGNKLLLREQKKSITPQEKTPIHSTENTTAFFEKKINEFDALYYQEQESVRLLLCYASYPISNDGVFAEYLLKEIEEVSFSTPIFQEILNLFKSYLHTGSLIDSQFLLRTDNEAIKDIVINLITEKYSPSPHWEREDVVVRKNDEDLGEVAYTNILRLKWRVVQKMIEDNKKNLLTAQTDEEQEKFLFIHQNLKNSEKEIAAILGNVVR